MSLTTYSGLKASIANWLNRTDLTNEIPDFIQLAENRIYHELRIPTMEKIAVLEVDEDGFANIPDDFLELKEILWNYVPLDRISLQDMYARSDLTGTPSYFARQQYKFKLYPTPTETGVGPLRIIYYFDLGRLSDEEPTNSLLSVSPELYLFAALREAGVFLGHDPQQMASWEESYQTALARLITHERSAEFAGSTPLVQSGY